MNATRAYYNEFDPRAAAWLRELIKSRLIADGDVDSRSISEVRSSDLAGYTQCHFFAGIGGWSYALRLAQWPDDRPVWTGSCPCQPFSVAGKRGGTDDARHLWPEFYRLISFCRPSVVFGEQVASKDGLAWLDIVSTDMERADYAFGAADLCAAGVGAPHVRQRLYFMAHALSERFKGRPETRFDIGSSPAQIQINRSSADAYKLAVAESIGWKQWRPKSSERGAIGGCWQSEFIPCSDGKTRPIEPGTFPLAHGIPYRVGLLRGYGNAIVPQVAEEFIGAYNDIFG
jgi:DNA (cytosine-5)-methyltransferase 1